MKRHVSGLALVTLIGFGCDASAGAPSNPDGGAFGRSAALFVSVEIEMIGREFRVEAPGALVLEDAEGEERFNISSLEYQGVLSLALESSFLEAIASQSVTSEACRDIPDGGYVTTVIWADVGMQSVHWGMCSDQDHPHERLVDSIVEPVGKTVLNVIQPAQRARSEAAKQTTMRRQSTIWSAGRFSCGIRILLHQMSS